MNTVAALAIAVLVVVVVLGSVRIVKQCERGVYGGPDALSPPNAGWTAPSPVNRG